MVNVLRNQDKESELLMTFVNMEKEETQIPGDFYLKHYYHALTYHEQDFFSCTVVSGTILSLPA